MLKELATDIHDRIIAEKYTHLQMWRIKNFLEQTIRAYRDLPPDLRKFPLCAGHELKDYIRLLESELTHLDNLMIDYNKIYLEKRLLREREKNVN